MTKSEMWVSMTRCLPIMVESSVEVSVNHAGPVGPQLWSAAALLSDFFAIQCFTASNEMSQRDQGHQEAWPGYQMDEVLSTHKCLVKSSLIHSSVCVTTRLFFFGGFENNLKEYVKVIHHGSKKWTHVSKLRAVCHAYNTGDEQNL